MRSFNLLSIGALIASSLLLSVPTLEAQTLEDSIAPPPTVNMVKLSPSQLTPSPAAEPSAAQAQIQAPTTEAPVELTEKLPEIEVVEAQSESAFGVGDVENIIEGILSKKKITGALVGTTISAALSAHPVGAFLGGLVGAMVGKESKYQPAHALTSSSSNDDLFMALESETENTVISAVSTTAPPVIAPEPLIISEAPPVMDPADQCYKLKQGRQVRDRTSLRSCFYYMY